MRESEIEVNTSEDFAPSDRLRNALDAVIAAYNAELDPSDEDEVTGFAANLQIGDLGGKSTGPRGTSWRNGCWGFDIHGGGCGWYQDDETSCVGYKFG